MRKVTLTDFEVHLIFQSLENFSKFVENNPYWESTIVPREFVITRIAELHDKINNTEKIK